MTLTRTRETNKGVVMTGDEFKHGLRAIGWKQADMCRKLSLNKSTVSAWATEGPPAWAAEYLRTLVRLHELHEELVTAPPLERLARTDDE